MLKHVNELEIKDLLIVLNEGFGYTITEISERIDENKHNVFKWRSGVAKPRREYFRKRKLYKAFEELNDIQELLDEGVLNFDKEVI